MAKQSLLVPLFASFLAAALPAPGQNPGVVRETADVSLVEVPVNVTGRDGKPVTGLTQADFVVEDEGQPQKLLSVDVVDLKHRTVDSSLPSTLPAAARRHFLLLFDFSFATPNEIVHARRAALKFIQSSMEPEDLAAVGITSVEKGARLLVTFTSDRVQLAAAVRILGLPNILEQARDPLAFAFIIPGDPHLAEIFPAGESDVRPSNDAERIATTKLYAMMAQKTADSYATSRVMRHLGEMSTLAQALDTVEGRKTIIYFSEGFDGRLLTGNINRSSEKNSDDDEAMFGGHFWTIDVDKRYGNTPLQRELGVTLQLFRRSDCIVYPIDIAGLRSEGDESFGGGNRGEEALFAFANDTGGELIKNANDLTAQMRRINEKTSLTYVLSFRPTVARGAGAFHSLKVRVRAKGTRVSARAGYYEGKIFHAMSPLERALAAADVIATEKTAGDFPISLLAVPFSEEHISRVPILVHVPAAALRSGSEKLPLGVYVYATDENGRLADYFTRTLSVDLTRERASSAGLIYYGVCRLLPGKYRVRAYVRDESNGRFGFQAITVDVPEFGTDAMQALPPIFLADDHSVLKVKDASSGPGEAEPFQLGEQPFLPQISPSLAGNGHSKVCLMLYRKESDSVMKPFQIDAEIVDASGNSRPARLSVVGRSAPDAAGPVKILLDFVPGVPAGEYLLRVTFRDPHDRTVSSASSSRFHVS
jgi:VWFA-related protein